MCKKSNSCKDCGRLGHGGGRGVCVQEEVWNVDQSHTNKQGLLNR